MEKNIFIFDLDGTIVDTQTPFHAVTECALLDLHHGIKITPEDISSRFAGISTKQVFKELAPQCNPDFLVEEKWQRMYRLAKYEKMECLPEMYELIFELNQKEQMLAVASASPKKWIELCLENAELHDCKGFSKPRLIDIFEGNYFSAEDCKNPKPAPDVFLKAHASFGPARTIEHLTGSTFVIGDGRADVLGGLAADCQVLYLSSTNTEFDKNRWVTRFDSSKELCEYIRKNLLN